MALYLGDWDHGDSLVVLVFLPFGLGSKPGLRIPPKPTAKDLCWRLKELARAMGGLCYLLLVQRGLRMQRHLIGDFISSLGCYQSSTEALLFLNGFM